MRIWNATVEFLILENKRNYYNLSIWKCKEEMVTGKWLDYRYQMKDNERCQMNRTMWNWRNWRKLQKYSLGRWSWWIGDNCKSGFNERNNRIKMVCNLLKYSAEEQELKWEILSTLPFSPPILYLWTAVAGINF